MINRVGITLKQQDAVKTSDRTWKGEALEGHHAARAGDANRGRRRRSPKIHISIPLEVNPSVHEVAYGKRRVFLELILHSETTLLNKRLSVVRIERHDNVSPCCRCRTARRYSRRVRCAAEGVRIGRNKRRAGNPTSKRAGLHSQSV